MATARPDPAANPPGFARFADSPDTAGEPGFCCLCGRRTRSRSLCLPCTLAHADPATRALPPWLAALKREAMRVSHRDMRRLARDARSRASGHAPVYLVSLDRLLDLADHPDSPDAAARGQLRRLLAAVAAAASPLPVVTPPGDAATAAGGGLPDPRRAPALAAWLARPWATPPEVALRRFSPSGVPLDMRDFLVLLDRLFGWPPPGSRADPGHAADLVDLYERVYPA